MPGFTEEGARKKWCPFSRVEIGGEDGGSVGSANRIAGVGKAPDPDLDWPAPRCIASDCMAWRLMAETVDAETNEPVSFREQYEAARTGDKPKPTKTRWSKYGYCGLAGRPE